MLTIITTYVPIINCGLPFTDLGDRLTIEEKDEVNSYILQMA